MLDVNAIKEDFQAVGKAIVEAPAKAVGFLTILGQVPDHVFHVGIILSGIGLVLHGAKDIGTTVITAGLAMFKGQSK